MWNGRSPSRALDAFDFMGSLPSNPIASSSNPPFRIMDVWHMSVKRADAHLGKFQSRSWDFSRSMSLKKLLRLFYCLAMIPRSPERLPSLVYNGCSELLDRPISAHASLRVEEQRLRVNARRRADLAPQRWKGSRFVLDFRLSLTMFADLCGRMRPTTFAFRVG